jgi:hypothetical protein
MGRFGHPGSKIHLLCTTGAPLGTVIYVGETLRSMEARFRDSFRADVRRHYGWIEDGKTYSLYVWHLRGKFSVDEALLKCIEAELVFIVWLMQGGWPTYQKGLTLFHCMNRKSFRDAPWVARAIADEYFEALEQRPDMQYHKPAVRRAREQVGKLAPAISAF